MNNFHPSWYLSDAVVTSYVFLFSVLYTNFAFKNSGLTLRIEGPGRYREVGDAHWNNSVLIAPLNSFMVPSYDQKPKNFTSIKFTSIKV